MNKITGAGQKKVDIVLDRKGLRWNVLSLWLRKLPCCQIWSFLIEERYIPVSSLRDGTVVTSEERGLVISMLMITLGRNEEVGRAGLALRMSGGRSNGTSEMVTAAT